MRRASDEAADPKYAHIERERRWLVNANQRPDLAGLPSVLIEDRYITKTRCRLRRMTDSASGEQSLKLTKKYEADDPRARPIVTTYLTEAEYEVFSALEGKSLVKRRFKIEGMAGEFSLDQFAGALAGLELAEIEWPDDEGLRLLPAPIWATREVSDDPRFQGGTLATYGLPKD